MRKKKIRKWRFVHLYVMWSEEKLTIEVGLFYKVWICDVYLRVERVKSVH